MRASASRNEETVLLYTSYFRINSLGRLIAIVNATFEHENDGFGCVKYCNRGSVHTPDKAQAVWKTDCHYIYQQYNEQGVFTMFLTIFLLKSAISCGILSCMSNILDIKDIKTVKVVM